MFVVVCDPILDAVGNHCTLSGEELRDYSWAGRHWFLLDVGESASMSSCVTVADALAGLLAVIRPVTGSATSGAWLTDLLIHSWYLSP